MDVHCSCLLCDKEQVFLSSQQQLPFAFGWRNFILLVVEGTGTTQAPFKVFKSDI